MTDSFDPIEYLDYLRKRWMFTAAAAILAAAVALAACWLMPKQYTAKATLIIESPGADPRTATAVSSIYLESLKAYEAFAGSDSLFAKACAKFHLPSGNMPFESFKRHVLKVNKLKDTKVLEIRVTLPDAQQAQALVQYLAEATVALARDLATAEQRELLDGTQQQLDAARQARDLARADAAAAGSQSPALEREVQAIQDRLAHAEAERLEAGLEQAENTARGDRESAAAGRAGADALTAEIATAQRALEAKSSALAVLTAHRQTVEGRVHGAEEDFDRARKRADDLFAAAAFRNEQIRIVDPGVVPQTPSSPNPAVAVIASIAISSAICLVWLTLQFGLMRRQPARTGLRVAGGGVR